MAKQTLSQFMWWQRQRIVAMSVVSPRKVSLMEEDIYEGPAEVDHEMVFEYRRGIVVAEERV